MTGQYTHFSIFFNHQYMRENVVPLVWARWVQWVWRTFLVGLQILYKNIFLSWYIASFSRFGQECEKTPVSVKTGRTIWGTELYVWNVCEYKVLLIQVPRTIIHYNNVWIVIWWKVGLVGWSSLSIPRFTTRIFEKNSIYCLFSFSPSIYYILFLYCNVFVCKAFHAHLLFYIFSFHLLGNDERSYIVHSDVHSYTKEMYES